MKPIAWRITWQGQSKDYPQRSAARGALLWLKARGIPASLAPVFE